ncbi:MAG TPA: hypothetical protein ENK49_11975 [Gammaproteobacteria bacterium]|nr:hypothetical protein [Gammaproteobacteria bacterium]
MSLEAEIRGFLDKICVEIGFCLPPKDIEMLASRKQYIADDFIREIFEIEGLNPDMELKLFRQAKKIFTDIYGNEYLGSE